MSHISKGAIGGERIHPLRLRHSQSGHLTLTSASRANYILFLTTQQDTSCRRTTALSFFGILVLLAGPRKGIKRLVDHHRGVLPSQGKIVPDTPKGQIRESRFNRTRRWIFGCAKGNVGGSCCAHAAVVPVPHGLTHGPRKSTRPLILSCIITPPTLRLLLSP